MNLISESEGLVISPQWLQANLDNSQIVIVDCRFSLANPELGRRQYEEGHVPNAYYLDLNQDLSRAVEKHGGRHPLPDVTTLANKLANIGITLGSTLVVAYDDSKFAFASRLWWLLSYLGHDRVAVLNGGWRGWVNAGYQVSTEIPKVRQGEFTSQLRPEMVVDIEVVKARKDLPHVVLVDSREAERYRGDREPIDPIAGHIPGAVNYPWQDVSDEQGMILKEQRSRWVDIANSEEIIVYCGSGVTACVNLLSLKLAGIETSRLYAGSWSDWCSY